MGAVRAYDKLISVVRSQLTILMFQARGESRYGFVREDATTRARALTDRFIAGLD